LKKSTPDHSGATQNRRIKMAAKYRFDSAYGKLYEYDTRRDAYMWVMNTNAQTKDEAVKEYEDDRWLHLFGFTK
jgi:hypothetical protein